MKIPKFFAMIQYHNDPNNSQRPTSSNHYSGDQVPTISFDRHVQTITENISLKFNENIVFPLSS